MPTGFIFYLISSSWLQFFVGHAMFGFHAYLQTTCNNEFEIKSLVCGLGSACQVVKSSCGSGQFGYGLGYLGD